MNPLTNVRNIAQLNENDLKNGIFDHNLTWHSQYKDSAYIFIGGLPYDLTEGDILCVFSQYGETVDVNLVRDKKSGKSKGYGFLCYEDQRSTILAVDNFNNIKLGGRTIRVDHVSEYRAPKGDEKDEDGKFKIKVGTSCAPKTPSPSPSSEDENVKKVKKKKKEKKKKKKHKHKKDMDQKADINNEREIEIKTSIKLSELTKHVDKENNHKAHERMKRSRSRSLDKYKDRRRSRSRSLNTRTDRKEKRSRTLSQSPVRKRKRSRSRSRSPYRKYKQPGSGEYSPNRRRKAHDRDRR